MKCSEFDVGYFVRNVRMIGKNGEEHISRIADSSFSKKVGLPIHYKHYINCGSCRESTLGAVQDNDEYDFNGGLEILSKKW